MPLPKNITPKSPEEINQMIIDNLGSLKDAHAKDKQLYFQQGLPFYTCVDGDNWTKEFPNGEIHLVHRDVNLETFEKTETLIKKLTPATTTKTQSLKIK